ncbi:Exosome complex exonuclease RRP46 [Operophtera brumata]|uniref:Exosome complex exonuclease RRP46 n=1 Tax=Operophtera brumata TaxID=104452 RepID=A0A0L7KNB9_OPEBR|nr:Exosome complex exonuclease RRP46 [Operophtera brumata]
MGIEFDSEDFKLKPLKCELNFINKSDGSAILSQGKFLPSCETAILGSLYPRTGITVTIQELEDYGGVSTKTS